MNHPFSYHRLSCSLLGNKQWRPGLWILLLFLFYNSSLWSQSPDYLDSSSLVAVYEQIDSLDDQLYLDGKSIAKNIGVAKQLLPLYQQVEEWDNQVNMLNILTYLSYLDRDFDAYSQYALQAYTLATEKLPPTDDLSQTALQNMAIDKAIRGRYREAIAIQKEYCQLQARTATAPINEAVCYQNMGSFYKELGDLDQASRYFKQSLQIRKDHRSKEDDKNIVSNYAEMAHNSRLKGELDSAMTLSYACLQEADLFSPKNKFIEQNILYSYQNLAYIFLQKGDEKSCQDYLNQALKLQEGQLFARAHETYQTLGRLRIAQQQYELAIDAFLQAIEMAKASYNYDQSSEKDKHHTIAQTLVDLGEVYLLQENPTAAIPYLQEALLKNTFEYHTEDFNPLPTYENFLNLPVALNALQQIALAYQQLHQKAPSSAEHLQYLLQACALAKEIIIEIRHSYKAQGSKQTLARKAKAIYETAIHTCFTLHQQSREQGYLHLAFDYAESSKAALLMESIQEQSALGIGDIPENLQRQEQELRIDLSYYKKKIAQARKEPESVVQKNLQDWEKKAFEIQEAYQELIDGFELHYPNYYQLKFNTATIAARDLQEEHLKEGAVMIHYFLGRKNNFAFSISPQKISLHRWPVDGQLGQDIQHLRGLIATPPPSPQLPQVYREFGQKAHQLYGQLLAPLSANFPAGTHQLIFVPDGITNYLPFEVLLQKPAPEAVDFLPSQVDYLLNDYAISYNYSATLWSEGLSQESRKAPKPLIAFAPDFKSPEALSIRACSDSPAQLLCNEREVSEIQAIWGGEIKVKAAANKAIFLQTAPLYDIIHLATHACIDEYQAELSQIFFMDSSVNSLDLQNLRLNARLVVLSACNTGSGRLVEGEGVLSLARNFIHAGCPSALMSLWSVDDCKTSDLMISFYKNLADGLSKDAALRQTKLDYLAQTTDKIEAHPYFWAGFVQTGNPNALQPPARFGALAFGLLFLVLGGLGLRHLKKSGLL